MLYKAGSFFYFLFYVTYKVFSFSTWKYLLIDQLTRNIKRVHAIAHNIDKK